MGWGGARETKKAAQSDLPDHPTAKLKKTGDASTQMSQFSGVLIIYLKDRPLQLITRHSDASLGANLLQDSIFSPFQSKEN